MIRRIDSAIERLAASSCPMWQVLVTALAIAIVRGFLEDVVYGAEAHDAYFVLLHVPLSYLSICLTVALIIAIAGRVTLARAARLTFIALPVILLVPLIDMLASAGSPRQPGYFHELPGSVAHFLESTLFLRPQADVTIGQQVVVMLTGLGVGIAAWRMGASRIRGVLGALATLLALYAYGMLAPAADAAGRAIADVAGSALGLGIRAESVWHRPGLFPNADAFLAGVYLIVLPVQMGVIQLVRPIPLVARCLANARGLRLYHYLSMYAIGIVLALRTPGVADTLASSAAGPVGVLLGALCISALFLGSVWLNDIYDFRIDLVSSPSRPVASRSVEKRTAFGVAAALLGYGLLGSLLLGPGALTLSGLLLAMSFAYSAPPLRLRRFLGASHLTIGVISALVAAWGASLLLGAIPDGGFTYVILGLGMALVSTAKDVKDTIGDRRAGVATLMTITRRRKLAGALTGACIISGAIVLGYAVLGPHKVLWLGAAGALLAALLVTVSSRLDAALLAMHASWMSLLIILAAAWTIPV